MTVHVHMLSEGYLVTGMSHYVVRDCVIYVHVRRDICVKSAIKGTTVKFCVSGSQKYLALPTVGYPTCSDKWQPDKLHSTVFL